MAVNRLAALIHFHGLDPVLEELYHKDGPVRDSDALLRRLQCAAELVDLLVGDRGLRQFREHL